MFQRAVVRRQADREDKKYGQTTCLRMHSEDCKVRTVRFDGDSEGESEYPFRL